VLTTLVDRVGAAPDRILLSDSAGEYCGADLISAASSLHRRISTTAPPVDNLRLALLAQPGIAYVSGMLAGWMGGAMIVPLCPDHPAAEMLHVITDADVHAVLVDPRLAHLHPATGLPTVTLPTSLAEVAPDGAAPHESVVPYTGIRPDSPALMLYTSGTTGRPKGVVHTHATMNSQIACLVEAWEWTERDRIPHFLPLHHVHGLVNQLLCPLWVGARCDMFERFDATTVFDRMSSALAEDSPYSIFMAVPTVYAKAVSAWEAAPPTTRQRWTAACRSLRVMISGSAALPVPVLERWREISGHTLLERYGMTEIGIALGNPLHGDRRAGFVGLPLPGMQVRVVDDNKVLAGDGSGELQVRGVNVFVGYWRRPDETAASFTHDGWFRTGDQVAVEDGLYRISGRLSTDIIKSGGYKISALEIESVLAGHPAMAECCVVGVPDDVWGERVAAAIVLRPGEVLSLDSLRDWARPLLAAYKLPTLLRTVETLPRNVMGKVVKPEARSLFS